MLEDHPSVAAARRLATELLEPDAARVDLSAVPRTHLDAIAGAGLLGLAAPRDVGGAEVGPAVFREVAETLAGADAATWFVQAQHHSPVRMLAAHPSAAAERHLPMLARGELLAGIAFSQLRRFPQRPVTATRDGNGWRFAGVAPWYTGWGLNDVAFIAAAHDDEVVFGIVDTRKAPGLQAKSKLHTAALNAAQTVVLSIDNVYVDDADVALVQPIRQWLAADRATSSNANSAIFGVGRSALRLLEDAAITRDVPMAKKTAEKLRERFADVRARAYALADEEPSDEVIERRLATRAEALETLIVITTALVAANSGPAMAMTSSAQRKAREALFLVVQAQTAAARDATLERWAH